MVDVQELELRNNQLSDQASGMLLMACFANPKIKRITICYNYLRQAFGKVLRKLTQLCDTRQEYLNIMGSNSNPDHMKPIVQNLNSMKSLKSLNLGGCQMTQQAGRILANFLLYSYNIKELDISHCGFLR